MKKKIKNITLLEANKLCFGRDCENCPLLDKDGECILDQIAGYRVSEAEMEREIEVSTDE